MKPVIIKTDTGSHVDKHEPEKKSISLNLAWFFRRLFRADNEADRKNK
jgi:hypothetical protein